jgi:hypothetical protein
MFRHQSSIERLTRLDVRDVQPLLEIAPKTNGEPTLDEEVDNRVHGLVA